MARTTIPDTPNLLPLYHVCSQLPVLLFTHQFLVCYYESFY